ncbi:2-hydroxyacid dehydrogenase [Pseudooceanicola batsensis HTCC2597]|uniref:2-hydroxyacid dehydrogenase n=1 Tax=Pseudooceanicola batsensis (strain ATCC BAA-863 / DSM 15984 / KCTC 12145 / HTCC2597) TaxID=252305 RepID=A3TUA7_PSEBH|nr:hypothetical protein [Pseudooceanicola batsensis]EAQ04103.1 2-hydroxyacid dehydrogenase [Pseudooceanicola batsensis HTCC2597]
METDDEAGAGATPGHVLGQHRFPRRGADAPNLTVEDAQTAGALADGGKADGQVA